MTPIATPAWRVLVVDDQSVFRDAVSAVFSDDGDDGDFAVVAEAHDRPSALAALSGEQRIDVALIDINLGDDDGVDLARSLASEQHRFDVVLVSTMSENDLPADAGTSGALGFICKSQFTTRRLADLLSSAKSRKSDCLR